MKNQTHYLFSLGLIHLYTLLSITEPNVSWLLSISSIPIAGVSLLPNILDSIPGTSIMHQGVKLEKHRFSRRYRHALTHSPWTMAYFLPFLSLNDLIPNSYYQAMLMGLILSWFSHLALDAFNSDGIPLGCSSIYSNHPVKHYTWPKSNNRRILRFARIPFDNAKANSCIMKVGVFFFSLNLADLLLNHLQAIFTIFGG